MVLGDLKKCALNGMILAHERAAWRALVKEATENRNYSPENSETRKLDDRKLREGGGLPVQSCPSSLTCPEPGRGGSRI